MTTCQKELMAAGKAYPRTCEECGLGPCTKEGHVQSVEELSGLPRMSAAPTRAPLTAAQRLQLEKTVERKQGTVDLPIKMEGEIEPVSRASAEVADKHFGGLDRDRLAIRLDLAVKLLRQVREHLFTEITLMLLPSLRESIDRFLSDIDAESKD